MSAALALPSMASEISGTNAVAGSVSYTVTNGIQSYFPDSPAAQQAYAAIHPQSALGNTLSLDNSFTYDGTLTPAIFTADIGGQTGMLTLTSITGIGYGPNGMNISFDGTFGQPGYAQEMATASFLLSSEYLGNNVDLMMFQGFVQLPSAPTTPEPGSIALLGTGALFLAGLVKQRMAA